MTALDDRRLLPEVPARQWTLSSRGRPLLRTPAGLMAIVNLTPDSFSDGGAHLGAASAANAAAAYAAAGASWIDIGGESTRPGAATVNADEELARVLPAIVAIRARGGSARLSIDTRKAAVARAALAAGAELVNDVSAGADPGMFAAVAAGDAAMVLMHMQGDPATMQRAPRYRDVVDEVISFLAGRVAAAEAAGLDRGRLLVDPGIGFGKTVEHNLALLAATPRLARELDLPLVIGLSRKSFLTAPAPARSVSSAPSEQIAGTDTPPAGRDGLSHVLHAVVAAHCALLRVHDVAGARAAIAVVAALRERGHA